MVIIIEHYHGSFEARHLFVKTETMKRCHSCKEQPERLVRPSKLTIIIGNPPSSFRKPSTSSCKIYSQGSSLREHTQGCLHITHHTIEMIHRHDQMGQAVARSTVWFTFFNSLVFTSFDSAVFTNGCSHRSPGDLPCTSPTIGLHSLY